jgi:hypothetical protein
MADFQNGSQNDGHVCCRETGFPTPAANESPTFFAGISWWDKAIEAVDGSILEQPLSQASFQFHVHMCVLLLALFKTHSHLRKQLIETTLADVAPDMQACRKVGRMQHALIQTPMADEQKARLGGKSYTGVSGRAGVGRDDASCSRQLSLSSNVSEWNWIQATHFVSKDGPYPLPSVPGPAIEKIVC